MKKAKRISAIMLIAALMLTFVACKTDESKAVTPTAGPEAVSTVEATPEDTTVTITDANGETIILDKPACRIISTYSAITENIFALGAGDKLIGVGSSEAYPPEALELPSFSYSKDDIEKFIAAAPDVIFFRRAVANKYADLVSNLNKVGIVTVALDYDDFDQYIKTIAAVVGKSNVAETLLADFHKKMDALAARAAKVPENERKGIFFESSEKKYKTASEKSMAYSGLEKLSIINVAKKNMDKETTSSVAVLGEEYLLAEADNIDVYIAQLGRMNKNASVENIKARPGFDVIKAIKNDRILIISEKLISSPTFRQIEGLIQIFEYIYPEY